MENSETHTLPQDELDRIIEYAKAKIYETGRTFARHFVPDNKTKWGGYMVSFNKVDGVWQYVGWERRE